MLHGKGKGKTKGVYTLEAEDDEFDDAWIMAVNIEENRSGEEFPAVSKWTPAALDRYIRLDFSFVGRSHGPTGGGPAGSKWTPAATDR